MTRALTSAPATVPTFPSAPAWLAEHTAKARKRRRAEGTAANTLRALEAAARVFSAWCQDRGLDWLPASPEAVALFIDEYGSGNWTAPDARAGGRKATETGASVATVKARVSGINALHRSYDLTPPGSSEIVREALKALAKTKGTRQRQAEGLTADIVARMIDSIEADAKQIDPATKSGTKALQIAHRDAALIALAYDTLARRSEIEAMTAENIIADADGSASVHIERGKTDQTGKGRLAYIAPATRILLNRWTDVAEIDNGPLFRSIGPNASGAALSGDDIARIYRRRAIAAGIDNAERITGHSARVGFVQDAEAEGVDMLAIQQAGGWASPAMPYRYGERMAVKRGAAAQLAVKQGRV